MDKVIKQTLKKNLLQEIEKLQAEIADLEFNFDIRFKHRAEALSKKLVELNNLNNED